MPNREAFLQRLQAQLEELESLIMDELIAGDTRPLTKRPPDLSALPFCKALVSCETDEGVKSCVKSDIQGARACVNVAEVAIAKISQRAFQYLPRKPGLQTRFFFLTSVVMEYLQSQSDNYAI
jgi:hypothetical protein